MNRRFNQLNEERNKDVKAKLDEWYERSDYSVLCSHVERIQGFMEQSLYTVAFITVYLHTNNSLQYARIFTLGDSLEISIDGEDYVKDLPDLKVDNYYERKR